MTHVVMEDLTSCLPFEQVKQFFTDEYIERVEKGEKAYIQYDEPAIINQMKEYIGFAKEKAEDQRGLSAMRSMIHYYGWAWLIENKDIMRLAEAEYDDYGLANLLKIEKILATL